MLRSICAPTLRTAGLVRARAGTAACSTSVDQLCVCSFPGVSRRGRPRGGRDSLWTPRLDGSPPAAWPGPSTGGRGAAVEIAFSTPRAPPRPLPFAQGDAPRWQGQQHSQGRRRRDCAHEGQRQRDLDCHRPPRREPGRQVLHDRAPVPRRRPGHCVRRRRAGRLWRARGGGSARVRPPLPPALHRASRPQPCGHHPAPPRLRRLGPRPRRRRHLQPCGGERCRLHHRDGCAQRVRRRGGPRARAGRPRADQPRHILCAAPSPPPAPPFLRARAGTPHAPPSSRQSLPSSRTSTPTTASPPPSSSSASSPPAPDPRGRCRTSKARALHWDPYPVDAAPSPPSPRDAHCRVDLPFNGATLHTRRTRPRRIGSSRRTGPSG